MATLRLALLTTFSLALFFGLAIVGYGGPARFFSQAPLAALFFVTIALGIAAMFSQGHIGSGVREDRSNRWVLVAFTILGLALAYLPALCDRYDVLTFGGETVRWLGVAIGAAGGVLRLAPVFVLGRRFSGLVAIQPNHNSSPTASTASSAIRPISGSWRPASAGSGVPRRRRARDHRTHPRRADRAHERGGAIARRNLRRRIRGVPRPNVAARPLCLLNGALSRQPARAKRSRLLTCAPSRNGRILAVY